MTHLSQFILQAANNFPSTIHFSGSRGDAHPYEVALRPPRGQKNSIHLNNLIDTFGFHQVSLEPGIDAYLDLPNPFKKNSTPSVKNQSFWSAMTKACQELPKQFHKMTGDGKIPGENINLSEIDPANNGLLLKVLQRLESQALFALAEQVKDVTTVNYKHMPFDPTVFTKINFDPHYGTQDFSKWQIPELFKSCSRHLVFASIRLLNEGAKRHIFRTQVKSQWKTADRFIVWQLATTVGP